MMRHHLTPQSLAHILMNKTTSTCMHAESDSQPVGWNTTGPAFSEKQYGHS